VGAELWQHQAPWHEDPEAALRALQAQVLCDKYDLLALLKTHLDSAREAVRLTEQARAAVVKINEDLGRGESVCFPLHTAGGTDPVGWYFVGNTID
jgi:hypothetical protein